MAKSNKPNTAPIGPYPKKAESLHQIGDWLWVPLRKEWRDVKTKPEEIVRQKFIRLLVDHYGYELAQIDQERRTQHGHKSPRADIVVWQSATDKAAKPPRSPVLVVECKTDSIDIQETDYYQGESYSRASGCEFFVATNSRHTAVLRLQPGFPGSFVAINEIPKASDWGDAKRLKAIRESLRTFNRKEFQDLLFNCHSILRDVHKMDPGRAFDTISKILFIKMFIERSGMHGTFTTEYLDRRAASRMSNDPLVHDGLFELTKDFYRSDELFTEKDRLDISEATFRRIVKELERFDLSKTGDDIKGLAFERFLGTTFRGELGQFFTPRPVVEFMVDLLDPREGELICDPAAGSGGFLIRAFEYVRAQIVADVQLKKDSERARIESLNLAQDNEEKQIETAFADLNKELLPSDDKNKPIDTRVGRLAWQCIFGTDAEPRAARTAKMNMIMHGDGHGGIHYHDGLLDINGIFGGRFDLVLTNPPFGSNVGTDQKVGGSEETRVPTDAAYVARCKSRYGVAWEAHHDRLVQAAVEETPILDMFEIGKGKKNRPTELIFVERCFNLLKPGGRMGVVLPDGNLNNPSLAWLRRWAEGRAKLQAVVSLPDETFRSSEATVKASLVFMTRFSIQDEENWEAAWKQAHQELDPQFHTQRSELHAAYAPRVVAADDAKISKQLLQLAKVGLKVELPKWEMGQPPSYPRTIGATIQAKPIWVEVEKVKGTPAGRLKSEFLQLFTPRHLEAASAIFSELKLKYRAVDDAHREALWKRVREIFDYPVFVAAPKAVGITSTGGTGEGVANDLPKVLSAFSSYRKWLAGGSKTEEMPEFGE